MNNDPNSLSPPLTFVKNNSIRDQASLFERIGGMEGCTKIVEGMYQKVWNDPDLADFFRKSDKHHQIKKMSLFFAYTTGGREDWEGRSMKEMH